MLLHHASPWQPDVDTLSRGIARRRNRSLNLRRRRAGMPQCDSRLPPSLGSGERRAVTRPCAIRLPPSLGSGVSGTGRYSVERTSPNVDQARGTTCFEDHGNVGDGIHVSTAASLLALGSSACIPGDGSDGSIDPPLLSLIAG